jgi:cellulose synthase/poly-beta-1,6-N-acetylglucosamine synthase-like glycosyltransferase
MITLSHDITALGSIGAVVIGRNEGERLVRCLQSIGNTVVRVIYVDSGSSDGSLETARSLGATVLDLDMSMAFTAARARNAGFRQLIELSPDLDLVFFVDGDCEVYPTWINQARAFLANNSDVAVVCGRRREKHPQASPYNMLCDIEWGNVPVGETTACGGDAIIRVQALIEVDGYCADLICGEEPELCVRIRKNGWRVWRLDADMTLHDAAIYRFSQWWKRTLRAGYGFAQGVAMHGSLPEHHWVRESRRAWFWGLVIPLAIFCGTMIFGPWGLILMVVYPVQLVRLAISATRFTRAPWLWAGSMVVGKFPEMLGHMKYLFSRFQRTKPDLIEYK